METLKAMGDSPILSTMKEGLFEPCFFDFKKHLKNKNLIFFHHDYTKKMVKNLKITLKNREKWRQKVGGGKIKKILTPDFRERPVVPYFV